MLAKGSQEPRPCLWNFCLLSRSGGLLLEKLTHSLQIEASKHRPVCCLFLSSGGSLSPSLAKCGSHPGGKEVLRVLFSGSVFPELGSSMGTHTHRGRETHSDMSHFCKSALVNLNLLGTFLAHTDTALCVKLNTQHRGTESLGAVIQATA